MSASSGDSHDLESLVTYCWIPYTSTEITWLHEKDWFGRHLINFVCCWFSGPRIISAASNVVFWTFFHAKTCCVVCHAYNVSSTVEQIWRRKMTEKPHSIRLLRWFNFSQSGSGKNNRKAFKELPWEFMKTRINLLFSLYSAVKSFPGVCFSVLRKWILQFLQNFMICSHR